MPQTISRWRADVSRPQVRMAMLTTAMMFAVSGLVSGFAFGAFMHSWLAQSSSSIDKVVAHTRISLATRSATISVRVLGCPALQTNQSQQKADGQTLYTARVQAEEKYQNQTCNLGGKQAAIHDEGITCRLWLMPYSHNPLQLPETLIKSMQLDGPLPDGVEVAGGLIFDSATRETQPCQQGLGTWKYTISPSVQAGNYYLMGLTVWEGYSYNWSWAKISIENTQNNQGKKQRNFQKNQKIRQRSDQNDNETE